MVNLNFQGAKIYFFLILLFICKIIKEKGLSSFLLVIVRIIDSFHEDFAVSNAVGERLLI